MYGCEEIYEKFIEDMQKDGVNISLTIINVKDDKYIEENESGSYIDKLKIEDKIKNELKDQFDIIACDHTLGDDWSGIILLSKIRQDFKFKGEMVLFSAKIHSVIKKLLENNDQINEIKKLIRANITEFPTRDVYLEVIKGIVKNASGYDDYHEILKYLEMFPHAKAKTLGYERKTFSALAKEIENHTETGIEIKKIIINHGISEFINILNLDTNA